MPSSKENNLSLSSHAENSHSSEAEQIVQLKRLLVTLKQHYETQLHQLQCQLQQESHQKEALQKEAERARLQLIHNQKFHEEELQALRDQQGTLKELLKKSEEEVRQIKEATLLPIPPDAPSNQQQVEELERMIPYLKEQAEKAKREAEQLKEELEQAHKKIKKSFSQEEQETKTLEKHYIEILNEKMVLEQECKHLQLQFNHQSTHLLALQEKGKDLEDEKKQLEITIQSKEQEIASSCQENQELHRKLQPLSLLLQEKEHLQKKYEQLKDEWLEQSSRLEEALEWRTGAEQRLHDEYRKSEEQEEKLQNQIEQMKRLSQEKDNLKEEKEKIILLIEEYETRLKVSQQHLAKKVKETALLNEKIEGQQAQLTDLFQMTEHQKSQLIQLQSRLDLYQKQEKRLQDQLHEALKGTESQVMKWEEKYFHMHDRWLESQALVEKLKKFEEKHYQMQNLLAHLGNLMGTSISSPLHAPLFPSSPELPAQRPIALETSLNEIPLAHSKETREEKYDLFGMRSLRDKQSTDAS